MLSYVVAVITCLGMYLIGKKNKYGFLITFFNEFLWVYWIMITPDTKGLLIVCVVMMVISLKSYVRWCKDEKKIQKTKRVNKTRS